MRKKSPTKTSPTGIALVQIQKSEHRVSTKMLADHLGTKHRSTMSLLDKHREAFERISHLTFEMSDGDRIQGGGRAERVGLLTEDQAYLLLAMGRNTERVVDLKVRLVQAFGDARRAATENLSRRSAPGWGVARTDTKIGHHLIGFALKTSRQIAGKDTDVHHYQNEAKLIRYAMTGTLAPLDRDGLTREELKILARVERANAEMLAVGEGYAMRKGKCRVLALQLLAELDRRGRSLLERNGFGRQLEAART